MVTRLVHTLLSALLGLLSCLPASMRPGLFTTPPHPPPSTSSSPAPCQALFSHFPTSSCTQPCLSCWAPVSLPFSASPALRQWEEQGQLFLPLTFLLLVLGSLLLYLAVSLMDPGYVNTQPQPQESKEEQTAMVPQVIPIRRCRYCLVLQPLRARHCRDCRRCVRRYDHHCPWMENCVGERNHPLFVAYLALQLVVLLWGLYLAWSGLRFFQPWGLWLRSSGLLFATFLLLSLLSLVAGLLLASHLYLVASNTTTWEFISSHRIAYLRQRSSNPFDRGLTRNLAHFFCGWPSGSWETLWAEEAEEEGSSQAV